MLNSAVRSVVTWLGVSLWLRHQCWTWIIDGRTLLGITLSSDPTLINKLITLTLYWTSLTGNHHHDVVPDIMDWDPSLWRCTRHHGMGTITRTLYWTSWTGNHHPDVVLVIMDWEPSRLNTPFLSGLNTPDWSVQTSQKRLFGYRVSAPRIWNDITDKTYAFMFSWGCFQHITMLDHVHH